MFRYLCGIIQCISPFKLQPFCATQRTSPKALQLERLLAQLAERKVESQACSVISETLFNVSLLLGYSAYCAELKGYKLWLQLEWSELESDATTLPCMSWL